MDIRQFEANVLDKINEAEKLVNYVQMHTGIEQFCAITRWLIVADEATALLQQAAEYFTDDQQRELQEKVNAINPRVDLWAKYKDNPRRFKALTGRELFDAGDEK